MPHLKQDFVIHVKYRMEVGFIGKNQIAVIIADTSKISEVFDSY
jgi:hypothetical protein